MFRHNLMSKRGSRGLLVLVALLLTIASGRAQMAGSQPDPADPFGAYHRSLSKAMDGALAEPVRSPVEAPRSNLASWPVSVAATGANASAPADALNRVQQLRPAIEPILREEQLPAELAAIVLVESGGQPNALSPKGARGIWQFMPDTARRYGLTVSRVRDERLDIGRSTHAAAHYLRDLYRHFGDWQLTIAAYNAGEDVVQHAIERNHTSDFALLSERGLLPLETRRYVPDVIDAMHKVGNAGGFVVPPRNPRVAWILYAATNMATNQAELRKETKGELK